MAKVKRALLSVYNKEGIVEFARGLHKLGIALISTGGTARSLEENGLPVKQVSELTGFPEMMNGRVKTLHPVIHAGLLAVRNNQEHMQQLKDMNIESIDMVVCNLYPFADTIVSEGVTMARAIENIDIGGPTMIRAAAKNHRDVMVVVDPGEYAAILKELEQEDLEVGPETRLRLAQQAFRHTAEYDYLIQDYLAGKLPGRPLFPGVIQEQYQKVTGLRYGENPHQQAAFYREPVVREPSVTSAHQLHGKQLSFNNINDTNGALELIKEFAGKPAAAVIKHANPCGMALGDSLLEAYQKAHAGDPLSAFGSIVALTGEVTTDLAEEMTGEDKFIEVVIAPAYSQEALEILKNRWKNIRLLETGRLYIDREHPGFDYKKVVGGLLVQERDLVVIDSKDLQVVTNRQPTPDQLNDLLFSWKVVKHVKSNAIVMARDEMIVGVGAGQMSRVDAMIIAGRKADGRQQGGVVASDAFFPFSDAIEEADSKGIKAIIQPGGSIRDEQVIAAADEYGIAMVFTGRRHFRH